MKVLLSIKPEYAERIFNGEKRYEYRTRLFKRKEIKIVVVYVTKPVGKIIGEFEIGDILEGEPGLIWEKTKLYSGINENSYLDYFSNKKIGFAITIKKTKQYDKPLELIEFNPEIKNPPQSFMYV